jgi:hypothetical protein
VLPTLHSIRNTVPAHRRLCGKTTTLQQVVGVFQQADVGLYWANHLTSFHRGQAEIRANISKSLHVIGHPQYNFPQPARNTNRNRQARPETTWYMHTPRSPAHCIDRNVHHPPIENRHSNTGNPATFASKVRKIKLLQPKKSLNNKKSIACQTNMTSITTAQARC